MTMKCATFLLLVVIAGGGCSNSPSSQPAATVGIGVAYREGFRGDSIVLSCDDVIVDVARGYSGKEYVAAGSLFTVKAGEHKIGMLVPALEARAETTFAALPAYRTLIEAYFDRGRKTLSYKISYLDTEKVSLPQSLRPSLQSMMPR